METTAKVDIRKLQLLNDRISQTIEALNQVRLSVHGVGLSHTAGQQGYGQNVYGMNPYNQIPFQTMGLPYPTQMNAFGYPGMMGLSHSNYGVWPQAAWTQQWQQPTYNQNLQGVYGQGVYGQGIYGQNVFGGYPQSMVGGLGHTTNEVGYTTPFNAINHLNTINHAHLDPFMTARIMQAFPFAQYPNLPVQGF